MAHPYPYLQGNSSPAHQQVVHVDDGVEPVRNNQQHAPQLGVCVRKVAQRLLDQLVYAGEMRGAGGQGRAGCEACGMMKGWGGWGRVVGGRPGATAAPTSSFR